MAVRVFIRTDNSSTKAVAEVQSRLPAAIKGKGSRTNSVLDLMDAAYSIPYLMAPGGVVGRGVIGPGYSVIPHSLDSDGTKIKKRRIEEFFGYVPPVRKNIKDTYGPLSKLYTTAFMFRVFGHAAWEVLRDKKTGKPLGFDIIPGVVKPNIESDGQFKRPAYVQYLRSGNVEVKAEFDNPEDIIYFSVPDFSSGVWLNENLALSDYTLPSEIYAARAYKSLHENRNAPHSGFWYTPPDIDDDTFDRFVAMINRRYTGSENFGRNPLIMKGEGGYKALAISREDAPYIEGRDLNRKEIAATTGVPSPKYGVGVEEVGSGGLQEIRREFYESTLKPVMALLEEVIYRQVCIGLFSAPEWKVSFNRPDFTTALEDASIELRRIQWGQWSPNEARASRGELPRDGGDYYLVPKNMDMVMEDGKPGRPDNEPVDDDQGDMEPREEDTVPDTMPPEKVDQMVAELKAWRRFSLRVSKGQRYKREFVAKVIPYGLYKFVHGVLDEIDDDQDQINALFDDVLAGLGG